MVVRMYLIALAVHGLFSKLFVEQGVIDNPSGTANAVGWGLEERGRSQPPQIQTA